MVVQTKLVTLMQERGQWTQEDVEAAFKDTTVKQVVQKNLKNQNIQLVHQNTNEPVYQKELQLIGEKGERAVNESPNGDESQIDVDPAQTKMVSKNNNLTFYQVAKEHAYEELTHEIHAFIKRNTQQAK